MRYFTAFCTALGTALLLSHTGGFPQTVGSRFVAVVAGLAVAAVVIGGLGWVQKRGQS
jgi:hypothetical protein